MISLKVPGQMYVLLVWCMSLLRSTFAYSLFLTLKIEKWEQILEGLGNEDFICSLDTMAKVGLFGYVYK